MAEFSMLQLWLMPVWVLTSLYQAIACYRDNTEPPPGQLIDMGDHCLHVLHLTSGDEVVASRPTVVIDHSLGGVEGYLLIQMIVPLTEVCLCDRAGYGWSTLSRQSPSSTQRVKSLDVALSKAGVKPPYILVGNSLGSYHMRLYAHRFPEKVVGMVLTDGLHEKALLSMSWHLRLLQLLFWSGFVLSILGSAFGFIRLAAQLGLFGWLKPELRKFPKNHLAPVLRSFYRPQHWITMAREIAQLDSSGRQLQVANDLDNLPIVNIKARFFFKPTGFSKWLPLARIEQLRHEMHTELMTLSTRCTQFTAGNSSHFVWVDQPEVIVSSIQHLLERDDVPVHG